MKLRLARLVAAVLLALLVPLVHTETADAARLVPLTGRAGVVSLNGPMISAHDSAVRVGSGGYWITRTFASAGLTVHRSPSYSGRQYVHVILYLQNHENGRWNTWRTASYTSGLVGAGGWRFPAWSFDPENQPNYRDDYRVVFRVGWQNGDTGRLFAAADVVPSVASDNVCATRYSYCICNAASVYF